MAQRGRSSRQSKVASAAMSVLERVGTGVVTDALTRLGIGGWMDGVLPARPDAAFVGPAATVRFGPRRGADQAGVNLYEVIRSIDAGRVLVMEANGTSTSVFGGNIANQGQNQGLAAMVTDGRCRDFGEMRSLTMPVFCRGPTIRLPHDIELVALNVPVTCGGAQVNPGDIVMGDCDGVVVIPAGQLRAVLHQAEDVAQIESELQQAVSACASLTKINAILKKKKALRK